MGCNNLFGCFGNRRTSRGYGPGHDRPRDDSGYGPGRDRRRDDRGFGPGRERDRDYGNRYDHRRSSCCRNSRFFD